MTDDPTAPRRDDHLRRPFFYTEPENGVTLAVTYQGADGIAFVAQPHRAADEPYEQYGVVLPPTVARELALRMLATLGDESDRAAELRRRVFEAYGLGVPLSRISWVPQIPTPPDIPPVLDDGSAPK